MKKTITVVLPMLNEGRNVLPVYTALHETFAGLPQYNTEIIFVDDGSTDSTLEEIKLIANRDPNVRFISFSRNFGKDNAYAAGFNIASGDAVITMDADLQHPPELIRGLIASWEAGNEVAYYFRQDANAHASFFNQLGSRMFYRFINLLSDVKMENGISDYRLLDRRVVNALLEIDEVGLFYRGLVKWVGFRQAGLPYAPAARMHGDTKYNRKKLLKLAVHNLTSFSTKPLTIAIYLGFFFSFCSVVYIPYALVSKMLGFAISGWASIIVTIAFFGGLNLFILGIVGLYLGKVFMQSKGRPSFIIRESNIKA